MSNLAERSERLHSDIATKSIELDLLKEHLFVEEIGEILVEAGELDDCVRCSYKARGMKVDGYYYDAEFGVLNLLVAHWVDETDPKRAKVSDTEIQTLFKRCTAFFKNSMATLHEKIEVSNEAHDLAKLIKECRKEITAVKTFLVTDGVAKRRPAEIEEVGGVEVTRVIWDVERIVDFIDTGEKEAVSIDFTELTGAAIPVLSQSDKDEKYITYLGYIPGQALADLYSQWGTRLLDMNVRVFLSARGKVNRGIRDTIINDPGMFCAYNNGITVFSREVETVSDNGDVKGIVRANDFQIVNGGQTIASLYHASKKQRANLDKISVQMKLVVIADPDEIDVLVPRISEYSNTQNKVSLADLAANDPPHPELHEISKNLAAPDPTGGSNKTYWFYEKARGSYEETMRLEAKTPAKRRAFSALYPKKQSFNKGLFGKVWNTYLRKPHVVSLGAQKSFAVFNAWLREQEGEDLNEFFKKTVALLILWKRAELIVRRQQFDGYRHNIVTYTLSWLFQLTEMQMDLDRIWTEQALDASILEFIEQACQIVNGHIRNTTKNVTEWCKSEDCWTSLKEMDVGLPLEIESTYMGEGSGGRIYDPTIREEKETIDFCVSKGADAWGALSRWLRERKFLSSKARSQCYNMSRAIRRGKEPSFFHSRACKKAWEDAEVRGWTIELGEDDKPSA